MAKLDRLVWAGGVAFTAFGCLIGVRTNAADVPDDVLDALPPGWDPSPSPFVDYLLSLRLGGTRPGVREFHLLHTGLTLAARGHDRAAVLAVLEDKVGEYLMTRAPGHAFLHAGVVGWNGRAIVIPGRSRAGKTTLVRALLDAGATYLSDEYAVLDPAGNVHPYPRRLSVRQADATTDRVPAGALGAAVAANPLPVGAVLCAEYHPGADWRPRRLAPGRALLELAACMMPEATHTPQGREILERVATTAPVWKGPRGDARDVARQILRA